MWQRLDAESDRMKVPGGWIVRTRLTIYTGGAAVHQIFIADPKHEWTL